MRKFYLLRRTVTIIVAAASEREALRKWREGTEWRDTVSPIGTLRTNGAAVAVEAEDWHHAAKEFDRLEAGD
jgi:hypothetical protein